MSSDTDVLIRNIAGYDEEVLYGAIHTALAGYGVIRPGQTVVLKPNWVKESHLFRPGDWDYVITHPAVITSTLRSVLELLGRKGRVIITDGPQTDSSFARIMARMAPERWAALGREHGILVEVLDLREDEWLNEGDVTVQRRKLPGDPRGSTEVNLLGELSEFHGHAKSRRGYYGADYDIAETNRAHDGVNNRYRVSRTVLEADVFINLPKLKTHKKAGITCCLKNLVGINTYKNFLPHHSEGSAAEGGDQFPAAGLKSRLEGGVMAFLKQNLLQNRHLARLFVPLKRLGRGVFGATEEVVRSGNWYGNDTVWRMILDLNKVLLYGNPDGTMRDDTPANRKTYVGIVDAVLAGEGNGPMAPERAELNRLVIGTNPVAIDTVCARLMGFDPARIPAIDRAYGVRKYRLADFTAADLRVREEQECWPLVELPPSLIHPCAPHFGWKGHIEAADA